MSFPIPVVYFFSNGPFELSAVCSSSSVALAIPSQHWHSVEKSSVHKWPRSISLLWHSPISVRRNQLHWWFLHFHRLYTCFFVGNVFFSVLNFFLIRLKSEHNMRLHSNLSCKLHIFFTYYFITLSPTLLVAVSVQRYLAIAKHHYSKRHCTVRNAYVIIGLLCLMIFLTQLHWGIFYELRNSAVKIPSAGFSNATTRYVPACNVSLTYPNYLYFRSNMLGYIQWFCFTLCPFVTMLILNCLILRVIASARRIQQRMNQKNQRKRAKQRNMTIMLLSVSCVFILLTAPASTFMAFGHLSKNLHAPKFASLWIVFSLIYYANTAANFLLYFLTANVFRQELRVMILSLPGCSKLFPEPSRLLQTNTFTTGVGKFTTLGKTQRTSMALTNSAAVASDEEKFNGVNRKSSSNPALTVNSTNRLLSVPNTVNSSSTSYDEDSRLWMDFIFVCFFSCEKMKIINNTCYED